MFLRVRHDSDYVWSVRRLLSATRVGRHEAPPHQEGFAHVAFLRSEEAARHALDSTYPQPAPITVAYPLGTLRAPPTKLSGDSDYGNTIAYSMRLD